MKFNKILLPLFLMITLLSYSQASNRVIHEVDIIKVVQKNGRNAGKARVIISSSGVIERNGFENEKVDITSFTKSINELLEKEQKVVKVDGDDDQRTGFQEPYNGQHVFITVVFKDDFDKEGNLRNKTCYRYRETNLPNDQKEYLFFKYFSASDLKILKKFLN